MGLGEVDITAVGAALLVDAAPVRGAARLLEPLETPAYWAEPMPLGCTKRPQYTLAQLTNTPLCSRQLPETRYTTCHYCDIGNLKQLVFLAYYLT
jgi:hypothetical protein